MNLFNLKWIDCDLERDWETLKSFNFWRNWMCLFKYSLWFMCPDIKPIRVAANLEQPGIILLIKYLQKERGNKGQRCRGGKILGCKCEDRAKILMEFAIKSRHYATETCQAILQVYDDVYTLVSIGQYLYVQHFLYLLVASLWWQLYDLAIDPCVQDLPHLQFRRWLSSTLNFIATDSGIKWLSDLSSL